MNNPIKFNVKQLMRNENGFMFGKNSNSIYADKFFYNIGMRYFKKFIQVYPEKSNFCDENIIKEIISLDESLRMYKEPFLYVKNSIRQILCEYTIYKESLEDKDNKLDVNELINFIEENLLNKVEAN